MDRLSSKAMKALRREMAMMFQDLVGSLSPRMKVGDLVTDPFHIDGSPGGNLADETGRLLSLMDLTADFAERYPHQFSGGRARRVGMARTIALNPKLAIADEPTTGLDVSVRGEVLNLPNGLRERLCLAIVIITYNLHVVHHIADRLAVMYLSRFVETGPTDQVLQRPDILTPRPCCPRIPSRIPKRPATASRCRPRCHLSWRARRDANSTSGVSGPPPTAAVFRPA